MKYLTVDTPLSAVGVFWNPAKQAERFSGHFETDTERIYLSTAASMSEVDLNSVKSVFEGLDETIPILHGFTAEGACTLVGLHLAGQPGLTDFKSNLAVVAKKYLVSACVLGAYLPESDTPTIKKAAFRYAGLEGWIAPRPNISFEKSGITISELHNLPPVIDLSIPDSRTRVTVRTISNFAMSSRGKYSTNPEPEILLEFVESKSLDSVYRTALRLENFFSLCLGTSVALRSLSLTTADDETGFLVERRRVKADESEIRAWFKFDVQDLARAIAFWFTVPEEFRPVENLIYGTVRQSDMFAETKFLSLAQATESLHRGIWPTKAALNFRERIRDLLTLVSDECVLKLVGSKDEFIDNLIETRNFYTHLGIKRSPNVIASSKSLYLFNLNLHALLRLLLLVHVGFSAGQVLDAVSYQATRYK